MMIELIIIGVVIWFVFSKIDMKTSYKGFRCSSCNTKAMDLVDTYSSGREVLICRKCGNRDTNEPPYYWD